MSRGVLETPILKGSKHLTAKVPLPPTLQELDLKEPVPVGKSVMRIMTVVDGDKRFAWNPMSIAEINEAHDFFNQAIKEGLVPYKVGINGQASAEVMKDFDPHAGEIIFMPVAPIQGG